MANLYHNFLKVQLNTSCLSLWAVSIFYLSVNLDEDVDFLRAKSNWLRLKTGISVPPLVLEQ